MLMANMIRVGIVGGAGYTGGELLRILINHPNVSISFVDSKSNAGKLLSAVHSDLLGETNLLFSSVFSEKAGDAANQVDVLFLCVGHGDAKKFLAENEIASNTRIIDLSQDFRLVQTARVHNREFVYGLSELNRPPFNWAYSRSPKLGCLKKFIQPASPVPQAPGKA